MTLAQGLDLVSALLALVGAVLSLSAGLGLLRFNDLLMRMHAQTKPQIFGLMCILLAIALQQQDLPTILFLVPIMFFQMLTTPVGAATLARGGYRNWHFPKDELYVDALASAIELAERERAALEAAEADDDESGADDTGADETAADGGDAREKSADADGAAAEEAETAGPGEPGNGR